MAISTWTFPYDTVSLPQKVVLARTFPYNTTSLPQPVPRQVKNNALPTHHYSVVIAGNTLVGILASPTGTATGTVSPVLTITLAGAVTSPRAVLAGAASPPAFPSTLAAAVRSPTATLSGTTSPPVFTGDVAGTVENPTADFTGDVAVTAELVGDIPALAGTFDATVVNPGAIDTSPVTLTGTHGAFAIDFAVDASRTIDYTPTTSGSLVIQVTDPVGWQATFVVTDSGGIDMQDDTGSLGLIWVAGELMNITIAPVDGQPLTTVVFTWSYAERASSALSIAMDTDQVLETPGGLGIDIYGGQPDDTVTLSVLGPTAVANFQTIQLDAFGTYMDLMVRLPALTAGDYFLRVAGAGSGSEDTAFTVLTNALTQGDTTKVDDPAPVRDPTVLWRMFDLRDHAQTYTFVRNPSAWTNVFPPNDFTHDKTTAPDGQPLTWQAAARPWRMEFSGWLDTEAEYNALVFWSQLRRRLWLVDHRNRAWLITIEQFDAQAQVKPNLPWAHKYTVKTLVFMQG